MNPRFAVLGCLLLLGCVIPGLELGGRACPCAPGYSCDPSTERCLATPGGQASIQVSSFGVAWVTPNQIRWTWTATGTPDQLREYRLVVGTSEADVASETGSARVYGPAQNPELGRYFLPRTGGESPVLATTSDGLQPSTLYVGRLTATDVSGRVSITNFASQRTADPPLGSVLIFEDQDTAGFSIPHEMSLSTDRPHSGSHDYELVQSCAEAACFTYLRRQDIGVELSPIPEGSFLTGAYLELSVAYGGDVPSYYSAARLWFGDGSVMHLYYYNGFTIPQDDTWHTIQVPLRAMLAQDEITPLQFSGLAGGLFEFAVGGYWQNGARVRIDSIRIWY
ncbi:MAG: hypothetical protein U1E65_26490 [Myxococcota bacterium]